MCVNTQNLSNQMAGMSLKSDVRAPPTQFGAPPVPAPNAAANTPAPPMGHMNPQMNSQMNSQMNPNSRPIPSNNSMLPGAGIPPISNQNGAPQSINGPSQPFNGPTNQFATQV